MSEESIMMDGSGDLSVVEQHMEVEDLLMAPKADGEPASPEDLIEKFDFAYDDFNEEKANLGVWTKWPKLGAEAELKIASMGCAKWKEANDQFQDKYGDERGIVPEEIRSKAAPSIYASAIFRGIRGVKLLDQNGEPVTEKRIKSWDAKNERTLVRIFHFETEDDGTIKDTRANRITLLQAYPKLTNQITAFAIRDSNFEGETEESLRGN